MVQDHLHSLSVIFLYTTYASNAVYFPFPGEAAQQTTCLTNKF